MTQMSSCHQNNEVDDMIDESYELNFAVIQIEVVPMQLQFQHSVHHKNGQDGIAAIPQKIRVGRVGSVVIE